jgi:hypothetical protein
MKTLNVREVRAHLSQVIADHQPTLIGDTYHLRALIVPISPNALLYTSDLRSQLRKAQAAANRAFRQLRRGVGD